MWQQQLEDPHTTHCHTAAAHTCARHCTREQRALLSMLCGMHARHSVCAYLALPCARMTYARVRCAGCASRVPVIPSPVLS